VFCPLKEMRFSDTPLREAAYFVAGIPGAGEIKMIQNQLRYGDHRGTYPAPI